MNTNSKYFNIAVALVVLAAALLWFSPKGLTIQETFVLLLMLGLASLFPLLGMVLLIPISLLLWIKHYPQFFSWFGALGGSTINK